MTYKLESIKVNNIIIRFVYTLPFARELLKFKTDEKVLTLNNVNLHILLYFVYMERNDANCCIT